MPYAHHKVMQTFQHNACSATSMLSDAWILAIYLSGSFRKTLLYMYFRTAFSKDKSCLDLYWILMMSLGRRWASVLAMILFGLPPVFTLSTNGLLS